MMKNQLRGIFFDAGNTLLSVYPSVGYIYAQVASQYGVHVEPHEIERSFREAWERSRPFVPNEGYRLPYDREKDWWRHLVQDVFRDHVERMRFEDFFEHLLVRFGEVDCWRLFDDVMAVLGTLKERGFRMAIISNWGSQLPLLCDQLQITSFFEKVVVSAIVGYEKPHPQIFQFALEQTRLSPEEVLYIGDDPHLDYNAAKNVGMHSLHLDRYHRFPHHPDRIVSLIELLERL